MKITLHRLLLTVAGITAVAFVISAIVRHAKHGFAFQLGNVAWFTFLGGVLVTALLGLAALVRLARQRRARGRTAAMLGVVALVACAVAGGATGGTATRHAATERITATFLTIGRSDKPTHVVATGPISGIGEATQTEKSTASGQVNYVTLHFAGGTVRMTAVEPRFGWKLDAKTCTGSAYGNGTYTITGGTGTYRRASGKGTFATSGTAVAQRSRTGKCLGAKTPRASAVFFVKIVLTGTAEL